MWLGVFAALLFPIQPQAQFLSWNGSGSGTLTRINFPNFVSQAQLLFRRVVTVGTCTFPKHTHKHSISIMFCTRGWGGRVGWYLEVRFGGRLISMGCTSPTAFSSSESLSSSDYPSSDDESSFVLEFSSSSS